MTNIYMTWTQIKNKHTTESIEFKYHYESIRIQLYIIDGSDAYICYLPTQQSLDAPGFVTDNGSGLQTDLTDWEDNHKSDAEATEGVSD